MSQVSGQVTVTTAGTAVQGPNIKGFKFLVKALPGNTGNIYVGNDGNNDVDVNTGFHLSAGDLIYIEVSNLSHLYFDASVNAQKVCWILAEA